MEAATSAMRACCETAKNKDIRPFIPELIGCVLHPETVPNCVHKLAATVFVQEIKSPALAITVPLLIRGLQVTRPSMRSDGLFYICVIAVCTEIDW